MVVKYAQYEAGHFNSFRVSNSMAVSDFKILCDYHHYLLPRGFHHPEQQFRFQ